MNRPSPETVKQALGRSALALAEALMPDGKLDGGRFSQHREWHGRGPDGAKWGVVVAGPKLGKWQNFGREDQAGQSLLSLIRDAVCAGDHIAAYNWALDWLGDETVRSLPASEARPAPPAKPVARTTGNGLNLYTSGIPMRGWDEPIGQYLEGRGILREAFGARSLTVLRFTPRCWNSETQAHLPAMLAPVVHPITGLHLATHRTYLAHAPATGWRKAALDAPKKVLGSFAGGLIWLRRADGLVLAEGIENALSAAIWFAELGAAAYVAAGNLANLSLPPSLHRIVLIRDRDGVNPPIEATRQRALLRWAEEGRSVEVWEPPDGAKDANDYLQQVLAGEREE